MNWSSINAIMDELLDDADRTSYPSSLRRIGINRAMDYFAVSHTALLKQWTVSYTVGGVALPPDCIKLGFVYKTATEEIIRPFEISFMDGSQMPLGYAIHGAQLKVFPEVAQSIGAWYYALYPHMTLDSSPFQVPVWAQWPVINLGIAITLYPDMVGQANLRRFQTRREAGSPEDNPPRKQAEFFMRVYTDMVSRMKPQDRDYVTR